MPIRANPTLPKGLRKQKGGNFQIDVRLPDGRRYRECLGHSNRKLAENELSRVRTQIAEEKFNPEKAAQKRRALLTFKEAWEKFLPSQERNKSYSDSVRTGKIFLAHFGPGTPLSQIRPGDIESWRLGEMNRGLKVATVNRLLAVLRKFFNYLLSLETLEKSPMARLKLEDPKNERERQATREELAALSQRMKPTDFQLVEFAVRTGLRRGEMFSLRWPQIDVTQRLIALDTSKNGRPRRVPISDGCLELIQRLPSRLKSEWLFPNQSGTGPRDANNFCNRVYRPACAEAGIEDLTWHDRRERAGSDTE